MSCTCGTRGRMLASICSNLNKEKELCGHRKCDQSTTEQMIQYFKLNFKTLSNTGADKVRQESPS